MRGSPSGSTVAVQPVHLTDHEAIDACFASTQGNTRGMKVWRLQVGRFLADVTPDSAYLHQAVALSAA